MGKYPDTIAARLSSLKDQLAALGSWLTSTQNQPLDLDYICLQAPGTEPPEAEAGFFASVWGEIKKFIMSFFSDCNSIGSATDEVTASRSGRRPTATERRSSARSLTTILPSATAFLSMFNSSSPPR